MCELQGNTARMPACKRTLVYLGVYGCRATISAAACDEQASTNLSATLN